jgi:outer membrane protein assembly factor BamD
MKKGFRMLRICLIMFSFLLASCSNDKEKYEEKPVEVLYKRAEKLLEEGKNKKAGIAFEEVIRQHPYSGWAKQAQLMAAYAYYKAQSFEDAVAALDTYIQIYPGSQDIAYAYFLKGMCYYVQISTVDRDQEMTELARQTFEELIRRFPKSKYSKDAKLKLDLVYEHLAGKNMEIGRFYLSQKLLIAALNRFQEVIKKYEGTSHVPEALHRLIEIYLMLGIIDEAQATAVVLGHNYSDNIWYRRSYKLLESKQMLPKTDSDINLKKQWDVKQSNPS